MPDRCKALLQGLRLQLSALMNVKDVGVLRAGFVVQFLAIIYVGRRFYDIELPANFAQFKGF